MFQKSKKLGSMLLAMAVGVSTAFANIPVKAASLQAKSEVVTAAVQESDGFVSAENGTFRLNGSDFYYAGTNCYYLNFKPSEDVDTLIEEAADMGLSVIRTWGHLDVGTMTTTKEVDKDGAPVFENSVDGGAKEGVYYQYFDAEKQEPVVNEGKNGLQKMDYVLAKAQEENVKIILTFTNNWTPFGGMKQYTTWAGLDDKDEFYTNETVKGWFKNYIKTMLNHVNVYTGVAYKDDPTIFAWELANEPRSNDNLATKGTVYDWAKEMSAYVKSIDSNHMVSVGDEGCLRYDSNNKEDMQMLNELGVNFNWTNWGGGMGTDFERMLTIDTIDFATPHLYLADWSFSEEDAKAWIRLHGQIADKLNKPIILEEFGWKEADNGVAFESKDELFEVAYDIIEGEGEYSYEDVSYDGSNYWMIATHMVADGKIYPDYDGFTVYSCPDQKTESVRQKIIDHAEYMNAKGDKNRLDKSTIKVDLADMKDAEVMLTLQSDAQLDGITINGQQMEEGTQYENENCQITMKASYLSQLEEGRYYVTFQTTAGVKPELLLQVVDSTVTSAKLQQETYTFDKNPKIAKNVQIPLQVNDAGALRNVKLCGKGSSRTLLTEGSEYTFENGTLIVKANYLADITERSVKLELDFEKGEDPLVTIAIEDSTGEELIDDFEQYADDDEVASVWSQSNGGGDVTRTIVSGKSESKALSYEYNTEGRWWAGITKTLSNVNVSRFSGIQFWLQPDGSQNRMTIQFRDADQVCWESSFVLEGTEPQLVQIPFSDFRINSGNATGEMGDKRFISAGIYINQVGNDNTNGIVYIDDLEAYAEGGTDLDKEHSGDNDVDKDIFENDTTTQDKQDATTENGTKETTQQLATTEKTATTQDKTGDDNDVDVGDFENPVTTQKPATEDGSDVTTEDDNKTETTTEDVDADATTQKIPVKVTTEDDNKTEATTEDVDADATTQKVPVKVTTEDDKKTEATTEDVDADATTQKVSVKVTTEDDSKTDVTTEDRNADATTAGVPEAPTTEDTDADATTEDRNADATTAGVPEAPTTEDVDADVTTEDRNADATTAGVPEAPTTEDTDADVTTEDGNADATTEDRNADATTTGVPEAPTTEDTDADATTEKSATSQDKTDTTQASADTQNKTETTTQAAANQTHSANVQEIPVQSIILNKTAFMLTVGTAESVSALVLPVSATNQKLSWSSANAEVATVDENGNITAIAPGVTVISVSSQNQITQTVVIYVKPAKVMAFKAKKVKGTTIKLSWKKQSQVTGYKVYKYNTKTKKYKLCKTTKKNYITISNCKKGQTYKYKVRAYKKNGLSTIFGAYSKTLKIKVK